MLIILSAGHREGNPGACHGGFCEYPETLHWCEELRLHLVSCCEVVIVTGKLRDKVAQINVVGGEKIAIAVHFNSATVTAQGSETLHYPGSPAGTILASLIQRQLGRVLKPNRGAKPGTHRMDGKTPLPFLRATNCPAVIVEPEFIRHRASIEAKKVDACRAIADGIIDYVDQCA